MQNFIIQDFQLFSEEKEKITNIIELKNWQIKFPQNKFNLNYFCQPIAFLNWKFEGESMQKWYKQFLKIIGEKNFHKFYKVSNLIITNDSSEEVKMLDDLWITLNKRSLISNLLKFEIEAIIREIQNFNYKFINYDNNIDILLYKIKFLQFEIIRFLLAIMEMMTLK